MKLLLLIIFIILALIFPALWVILGWILGVFVVLWFISAILGDG